MKRPKSKHKKQIKYPRHSSGVNLTHDMTDVGEALQTKSEMVKWLAC